MKIPSTFPSPRILLAAVALLSLAHRADAVQVSFSISGSITGIATGQFGTNLNCSVGDTYSVTVTYDSTLVDRNSDASSGYFFSGYGAGSGPTILTDTSLGGVVYHGGYSAVNIRQMWTDNGATDSFHVEVEGPNSSWCRLFLTDETGMALGSDGLPAALNISDWDGGRFEWMDRSGTQIQGSITGLRVAAAFTGVPDSGETSFLLAASFSAVALVRYKFSRGRVQDI